MVTNVVVVKRDGLTASSQVGGGQREAASLVCRWFEDSSFKKDSRRVFFGNDADCLSEYTVNEVYELAGQVQS